MNLSRVYFLLFTQKQGPLKQRKNILEHKKYQRPNASHNRVQALQQIHQNGLEPGAIMASILKYFAFLHWCNSWHFTQIVILLEHHEIRGIIWQGF